MLNIVGRSSSCPHYEPPAAAFKSFFARIKPAVKFSNGYFSLYLFQETAWLSPNSGNPLETILSS